MIFHPDSQLTQWPVWNHNSQFVVKHIENAPGERNEKVILYDPYRRIQPIVVDKLTMGIKIQNGQITGGAWLPIILPVIAVSIFVASFF